MGMPVFNGSGDAYWWLIQFCQYLEGIGFQEKSFLTFVSLGLDGEVYSWFFSWRKTNQNVEFIKFQKDFLIKFKPEFGIYFQDSGEESCQEKELKEELFLEKEQESLEAEKNSHDGGLKIKNQKLDQKRRRNDKAEKRKNQIKKEELRNSQIWSKQNIERAMKMMGITTKGRRRKKKRVRTWREESRLKRRGIAIVDLALKRRGIAIKGVAHKLDKPSPSSRSRGGAVCENISATKREVRRVADGRFACERKKMKIGSTFRFGQILGLRKQTHVMRKRPKSNLKGSGSNRRVIAALLFYVDSFQPLSNNSNRNGSLFFQQWDPGGNA